MLVLTRKRNQCIVVDDNIELYIVDISNDQVKIGIKAPKEVSVYRKEVYDNIKSEMKEAAGSSVKNLTDLKLLKKDVRKKGAV